MDNKNQISMRINSALAERGKMQKELAAAIGVTDNTISYFCSGKRTPNTNQIIAIAKYLHTSADYLLGLSNAIDADTTVQQVSKYTGLSSEAIDAIKFDSQQHRADGLFKVEDYLIREFDFSFFALQIYKAARNIRLGDSVSDEELAEFFKEENDFIDYRFQKRCSTILRDIVKREEIPIPSILPDRERYLANEKERCIEKIERIERMQAEELKANADK